MSRRALAAGLGVGGLLVGLALLAREAGPLAPDPVALADASALMLDTVAVRGRRVEASLNGVVAEVSGPDRVALRVADGLVPLRFDDGHGLDVEDRLLAVGRLRARGGGRYVEVASWAVVRAEVRPPAAPAL